VCLWMRKRILNELDGFFGKSDEREVRGRIDDSEKRIGFIEDKSNHFSDLVESVDGKIREHQDVLSRVSENLFLVNSSFVEFRDRITDIVDGVVNLMEKALDRVIEHGEISGVGEDDHHPKVHSIESHDTKATGKLLDKLVSGGNADSLHTHSFQQRVVGGGRAMVSGGQKNYLYFNSASDCAYWIYEDGKLRLYWVVNNVANLLEEYG